LHPLLQNGEIKAKDNIGVLLMEFFEWYGRLHDSEHIALALTPSPRFVNKVSYIIIE